MNEREQKRINKKLTDSLQGGDLDDVAWALDQGADIESVDRLGRPALSIAGVQGAAGSVELLIERGADVSAVNAKHGGQAIHVAVMNGNLDATRALLAAGADAGAVDSILGYTPLHAVAHAPRNRKDLVDLLVLAGGDVHAVDEDGNTPLHNAARHSNGEVAQCLLAHGADPERLNNKNVAPRDVFAKFRPAQGTLDAKSVFDAYDRHQALTQLASQTRPQDTELASPDEVQARRSRGRIM